MRRAPVRAAAKRRVSRSRAKSSRATPTLTTGPRIAFFEALATRFGPTMRGIDAAVEAWRASRRDATAAELHAAAEPRRQELLRRLNLAPGGTKALVAMREQLLECSGASRRSRRGRRRFRAPVLLLVQPRLPGAAPDRLVDARDRAGKDHPLRGGARNPTTGTICARRIDPPDRRCYAFFHPALVDEPLIFVEVALTRDIAGRHRADPRRPSAPRLAPDSAVTAVFYSISNCQRGLAGVSFGSFLIKQVVEEISREFPRLSTFVTLSPVPSFAALARARAHAASGASLSAEADRAALAGARHRRWWDRPGRRRAAARAVAARGRDLFPGARKNRAARRSIRSPASTSAMVHGSSARTGRPICPNAAASNPTA